MAYEVQWYEKNGKYPEDRIMVDDLGTRFVQWDRAWNRQNRYRRETIWKPMADYVAMMVSRKGISK